MKNLSLNLFTVVLLIGLFAACQPLAPQSVLVALAKVQVSEETQVSCLRGTNVVYTQKIRSNATTGELYDFQIQCTRGDGSPGMLEVKAIQVVSGRTGSVNFLHTNANGSTSAVTVGYRIVVREQNAALLVECFTDDELTKPCVLK
jgi:hypothetical protein